MKKYQNLILIFVGFVNVSWWKSVYNITKKADCFLLGEMPGQFKVKVNETAHFLYWGTINYHRIA